MATFTHNVIAKEGNATAKLPITVTYSTSGTGATDTQFTISFTEIKAGVISASGGSISEQNRAKMVIQNALSNRGVHEKVWFNNENISVFEFSRENEPHIIRESRTIKRTTSNQSKALTIESFCEGVGPSSSSTTLTVPALSSYSITYNANSGSGAPANQTKYYGVNINLQGGRPTKDGYTFKGWASSEANAKAGIVNYSPSQTYSGNAGLSLWAVWELTYSKPIITNFRVERCDANGNFDDDGGYAKAVFYYDIFKSPDARYYGGNTTPYANNEVGTCVVTVGTETATPTMADGVGTAIIGNGSFNSDDAYNASVVLTDTQQIVADHTSTATDILSTAYFPMDYNKDATAVGFFMSAPDNEYELTTDTTIVAGKTYYTRSGSAEPYKYTVVINPVAQDIGTYYEMTADKSGAYFGKDILLNMPDYQTAGSTDKEIYDALVTLGWDSDVIV